MKIEKINEMISGGESITVEFKQSKTKLNRDVFESVCAFLNRNGGHLFLGVNDSGCIGGGGCLTPMYKLKGRHLASSGVY
ncbi:MAG: putative DNA binding domain-containing protein [Candidatus Cloacimonetes bacterium]|nr:putative DNA binding domain-containing protein [Candidatus Cloacimonadota bacterium]MDY0230750.1 putative DNA binding domain-containing protein [Candidatus Cloacimonadaceae bacterium]